jgi:putative molybdopterin biosynthesis protein
MASYVEIARSLARRIAAGELEEGGVLPAMRAQEASSPATTQRAYHELADAGVIRTAPRRVARVAPGGAGAATRYLAGGSILRLAASDDPGLRLLVASQGGAAELVAANADATALAIRHVDGRWNEPFARAAYGPEAAVVPLWTCEVGLVVAPGNPWRLGDGAALSGRRVVREPLGSGHRAQLDELLERAGIALDASDPEASGEHAAAVAIASGSADVAFGSRAVARSLDLGFVPLGREQVALAGGPGMRRSLEELGAAARERTVAARLDVLGGYELTSA